MVEGTTGSNKGAQDKNRSDGVLIAGFVLLVLFSPRSRGPVADSSPSSMPSPSITLVSRKLKHKEG
ncbi:hypothetical protein NC652_032054 [Populus alba x Populus x berolinensis]|nr:hypothetical protein NC652_032050 [Populus alba x Populus x berolinensis]KAJ6885242.1 hypothetical protein NC652_032054 [Populus alba x Populus x berolinensis]